MRANIGFVSSVHLFNYFIEERSIYHRIDEEPSVDGSAVTGKGDAFIKHLLRDPAGQNKPVVMLMCVVERCIGISLCNERPPILGEGSSRSVRDPEDA